MIDLKNAPKIGELVTYKVKGVTFDMHVLNARIRYGQWDAQIAPIANGSGSIWVTYDSVKTSQSVVDNVLAS